MLAKSISGLAVRKEILQSGKKSRCSVFL